MATTANIAINIAIFLAVSVIFSVKEWPDFEICVGVVQGH